MRLAFLVDPQYPNEFPAQGHINGNTITINVPLAGFGPGRPLRDDTLFYVTAFSAGRTNSVTDIYADLVATRSFNFKLGTIEPPRPAGNRKVTGGGAIFGTGLEEAPFVLNAFESQKGKVSYRDNAGGVNFRSTRITKVTFDDATGSAQIVGTGINGDRVVDFTIDVVDGGDSGSDQFAISLSDGYMRGGSVTRGNVTIH